MLTPVIWIRKYLAPLQNMRNASLHNVIVHMYKWVMKFEQEKSRKQKSSFLNTVFLG